MKVFPVKTPSVVKRTFPRFIWEVDTKANELYLTFDDGPIPAITPWVLTTLANFNAKATFFCIGKNVEANPDILRQIINEGHSVGNHTYSHNSGWSSTYDDYVKDFDKCRNTMDSIIAEADKMPLVFRPPYGKIKSKQARYIEDKGFKIVMWDVLSYDWDRTVNPETCLNYVFRSAGKGSIVVLHDSQKAFQNLKYVLPEILEYYSAKGFRFKAI